ncbi:hypothetical protein BRADI_2g17216v3 [Brachypodium distachyon]|uniref:Uncharacterized protein n=1 Tax=Brachypodium distachyon TaxID=15368 RepID=A0A0Q3IX09_BRADI|nr:hypothetical protein BRADI_2g17216v3 [Brachypodium distachyon]
MKPQFPTEAHTICAAVRLPPSFLHAQLTLRPEQRGRSSSRRQWEPKQPHPAASAYPSGAIASPLLCSSFGGQQPLLLLLELAPNSIWGNKEDRAS